MQHTSQSEFTDASALGKSLNLKNNLRFYQNRDYYVNTVKPKTSANTLSTTMLEGSHQRKNETQTSQEDITKGGYAIETGQ